ncbi:hypothetical protein BDZ97DRAFT_1912079 [Flammula alnicola]|nr:hypothetical protein BDZ97DRAFT_1912079 [Flammula alnicola]
MDEEKRATLKAFLENPTVLDEVASVLGMRMASIESWTWSKGGILIEFRRHLNGKYRQVSPIYPFVSDICDWLFLLHRAFTDPKSLMRFCLHHIGVAWQVKLKKALLRIFDSKAWIRSSPIPSKSKERYMGQLGAPGKAARPQAYGNATGPAAVKQKLLHIMTTECHLNTAVRGTHATSKVWIAFHNEFLRTPLRFPEDTETRLRKRGTPISYALSVVCGEAVIFIMDFAVNQRAQGLFLYRMHNDLWLWDADAHKVADGWAEMSKYAGLRLPSGEIRWGFLRFDIESSRFVFDQMEVDEHIKEMRRQLASTRNFGGIPANCFGREHINDMIDTLGRIQRELFPADSTKKAHGGRRGWTSEEDAQGTLRNHGSARGILLSAHPKWRPRAAKHDARTLCAGKAEQALGVVREAEKRGQHRSTEVDGFESESDSSAGWDATNTDEVFVEEKSMAEQKFIGRVANDRKAYKKLKENWELEQDRRRSSKARQASKEEEFMSFEEYAALRESYLSSWGNSYRSMLQSPQPRRVVLVPKVQEAMHRQSRWSKRWESMDWYEQWVVSMYGEEIVRQFGGLEPVDPKLIPVGMVQLFRTSRMKLDQ